MLVLASYQNLQKYPTIAMGEMCRLAKLMSQNVRVYFVRDGTGLQAKSDTTGSLTSYAYCSIVIDRPPLSQSSFAEQPFEKENFISLVSYEK